MDTFPLDQLDGYLTAYRQARDKQAELESQLKLWREAVTTLGATIIATLSNHETSHVDGDKRTWFGAIDGTPVCRLTTWVERRVDVAALREAEPAVAERFLVESSRSRLALL